MSFSVIERLLAQQMLFYNEQFPTHKKTHQCSSWWTFRPPKKIFTPPPPNPQFAADTLLAPRPLFPSWRTPPPLGFSDKNRTPLPSRRPRTPPSPSPSRKNKKYPKRPPMFRFQGTPPQQRRNKKPWRQHEKTPRKVVLLHCLVSTCSQSLAVKEFDFMVRGICRRFFVKFLEANFPGNRRTKIDENLRQIFATFFRSCRRQNSPEFRSRGFSAQHFLR